MIKKKRATGNGMALVTGIGMRLQDGLEGPQEEDAAAALFPPDWRASQHVTGNAVFFVTELP